MKYRRIYHMLMTHGHSAQMALRIIVDATRGDQWSMRWIRRAHAMVPYKQWIERMRFADDPLNQLKKIARR